MHHGNIYPCTELVSGVAVAEQPEQAENTRIRDLTVTLTPVLLYTIMHYSLDGVGGAASRKSIADAT